MTPEEFPEPTIPGYTIKSVIGKGGFATVYLAQQHTLQRDVALKVMNPLLTSDADFCARFLREAQDTASVSNHPNIITVHDVGQITTACYMSMQHLPGPNLKQRIENADPSLDTRSLLYELGSALLHVHQKGFIHRDVKPANILFTESGEAVLSDFGIARLDCRSTQLTHQGHVVGTATYMSPEQSRGDPAIDARSDLYSLGVVLFEVLAYHPPFEASDPMVLMLKHLNEPIPRLPEKFSAYQSVLDKLMAKQVDQRYASAHELLKDLESGFGNTGKRAWQSTSGLVRDATSRRTSHETKSSTVLVVTLLTLVLLAISLGFLYWQSKTALPAASLRCPELTLTQASERDALIQLASAHQETGRSVYPPGANALEAYLLALELDPCNPRILEAVAQIRLTAKETP